MFLEMDWLKKWARYTPTSVAFKQSETGVEYTYGALYDLSCVLAAHFVKKYEIKRGDRVAVMATNELEYIPLFFALQRIGAIMVPVNFRLTGRELSHILKDSGSELLIYQHQFMSVIEKAEANIVPEKQWRFDGENSLTSFLSEAHAAYKAENGDEKIRKGEPAWHWPMVTHPEDPCMILYTSGTTGAAKGAIITFGMMHWNSINTLLRLNLNQHDVTISFAPFFHTGGWNVLTTPFIHRGAKTIIMRKFDPDKVLELCEKEKVTIMFGVPTMLDMMYHTKAFENVDLSSMRYMIVGGEPMPLELIKIWQNKGIPIRQGYGLTEFGPNVFSLNEEDAIRKIGSVGFANMYIETRVVDNDGKEVAPGEIGELLLRGPVGIPGYWNNPKATTETIRNGWIHTGDLVRYDEDGYFYITGRKKDMFISGGENVYPVEVEQYLSTHPAIREVAVIGVPDEKWGEVGKAYISLKADAALTDQDLRNYCEDNLARYKIPKHFEFTPELPKGDSGKILKRKLKEIEAAF